MELACATGLKTIHLSKPGIHITGVDISSSMLEYTRVKTQVLPVDFIEADARTFDSEKRFSMIYLTGNAFQAFLSDEDQRALLETVYKHLEPNGMFVFETRNPLGPIYPTKRKASGENLSIRMELKSRYLGHSRMIQVTRSCTGPRSVIGDRRKQFLELHVALLIMTRFSVY